MKAHEVDYQVFGDDLQFVEIELDPGETVIAEAGMMMYMEDGIGFETKMGDGSKPKAGFLDKLVSVGKRAITGESLFMTHFSSTAPEGKRHVAFGAPYPGKIMAIDLDEANGELICQKNSFLCAALGTELSIAFNKKIGAGLFGGEGFILQRLRGDGMVFVHAGGTIVEKSLTSQKIMVDTGCIVAFESTINYDIQRAGNLKSMIFVMFYVGI
jgi:uncharacterized protein (TIGR00266 family)